MVVVVVGKEPANQGSQEPNKQSRSNRQASQQADEPATSKQVALPAGKMREPERERERDRERENDIYSSLSPAFCSLSIYMRERDQTAGERGKEREREDVQTYSQMLARHTVDDHTLKSANVHASAVRSVVRLATCCCLASFVWPL